MKTDGPRGEIVTYQALHGGVEMEVRLEKETIWLNLNQIAVLFDRDKSVIKQLRGISRPRNIRNFPKRITKTFLRLTKFPNKELFA